MIHNPFNRYNETRLSESMELNKLASQGDQDAFVKLCESFVNPVYRYFFHQVRSITTAKTLTSETFHIAQESINDYRWHGLSFGIWLFLIARSVFDEWLRRKMPDTILSTSDKFKETKDEFINTIDVFHLKYEEDALWRLVKDLSFAQRRLLILRHSCDLSFAEIAMLLGRSENACRQLYFRALSNLKHKAHLSGLWS